MGDVVPFPQRPKVRAVDILITEHDGRFYADVDGHEIDGESLDQVLTLATARVRQVWPTDEVLIPGVR